MIGTHKNITSEVARKENIRNVKSRRRGWEILLHTVPYVTKFSDVLLRNILNSF
jgi:hypothetical protein